MPYDAGRAQEGSEVRSNENAETGKARSQITCWYAPGDVEANQLLPRADGAVSVDPDQQHLPPLRSTGATSPLQRETGCCRERSKRTRGWGERGVEGTAGEVEGGEGWRHAVICRGHDADAATANRGKGAPRCRGLWRLRVMVAGAEDGRVRVGFAVRACSPARPTVCGLVSGLWHLPDWALNGQTQAHIVHLLQQVQRKRSRGYIHILSALVMRKRIYRMYS